MEGGGGWKGEGEGEEGGQDGGEEVGEEGGQDGGEEVVEEGGQDGGEEEGEEGGAHREDWLAGLLSGLRLAPLSVHSDVVIALRLLHLTRVGELQ